ncbi:uncharacterized protein CTRU02_206620 [Colletotrichum truncatum]|uniref:Uncharacterized protein n=1 Tax=Colletotrichum truncatum TaxID=5467 RepID=A0ACC3Z7H5_COLTU|nr:uncharacterized protein CTRU02_11987 [Colletotrichum truncatum]KAF6785362.1 hypothetical protein CTRU02_11987 [Colletotrichum truncatum]
MPFYQVHHTWSLTMDQRQSIAAAITKLHCSAFKTPAFFVHVNFIKQDAEAPAGTYFMAGKPRSSNSNKIMGVVRTSPNRTKADWDKLAADIETAWDRIVGNETSGAENEHLDKAKSLAMIAFTPLIAAREAGMAIPDAGHEGPWLKEQLPYFKDVSGKYDLQGFGDLLDELKHAEASKSLST